jgi:hypothetical protein
MVFPLPRRHHTPRLDNALAELMLVRDAKLAIQEAARIVKKT